MSLAAPDVARKMREVLSYPGFKTEGHRKAALRRILHEAAAGMTEDDLVRFLDDVRSRFPDRTFESTARLKHLEERVTTLEAENTALKAQKETLERRAKETEVVLARLYKTAARSMAAAAGDSEVGGSIMTPAGEEALERFSAAIAHILTFAFDQETTLASIEETLGRPAKKGEDRLDSLLIQLARGGGRPADLAVDLERRLRRLHLLPAALMAGAQQSWKGGTRGLLEYLDPKAVEQEIPRKIPGLREAAVLKEVRRRYEQLWDELDKNIAHYYRGTFETVYSEKMEGRP